MLQSTKFRTAKIFTIHFLTSLGLYVCTFDTFQGILEPFVEVYLWGEDRPSPRYLDYPAKPGLKFQDRMQLLTKPYKGMEIQFSVIEIQMQFF